MKRFTRCLCLAILFSTTAVYGATDSMSHVLLSSSYSQPTILGPTNEVYYLRPKIDIPILAVGGGWSLYAFTKIYSKDPSPAEKIESLRKEDVNGFDRWAAGKRNPDIDKISYIPFYIAMPLPLALLADKEIRKDAPKVGFLYLESMAITGLLYTGSVYFTNRYRPQTYDTSIPVADRVRGGNKNSFFAGHVALIATSSFFVASVYEDYHPHSNLKYYLYGGAVALTGSMAYMRLASGNHFPSDILLGIAVGTGAGLLVPHLHRKMPGNKHALRIMPYMDENVAYGIHISYGF